MRRFELDRYLRASKRLDLTGIDFDRVSEHPLSEAEIRCLTYMMDIERHTVIYLRDLLSTRAAKDPDVTAFLSMWVYEEFWHGEAIGAFLRAAGIDYPTARTAEIRAYADAGKALVNGLKMLAGKVIPEFVAVHMTWGAMNEISTLYGYRQMIARTQHPILIELLGRIIKDELRLLLQPGARADGRQPARATPRATGARIVLDAGRNRRAAARGNGLRRVPAVRGRRRSGDDRRDGAGDVEAPRARGDALDAARAQSSAQTYGCDVAPKQASDRCVLGLTA